MNKYKIIKISNMTHEYESKNLKISDIGILVSEDESLSNVIFFNQQNIGDFTFVQVQTKDIIVLDSIPIELEAKIEKFVRDNILEPSTHLGLTKLKFNEFDYVELQRNYNEYGIKEGDRGTIANDKIIKGKVLVDFTGVTKTGETFGDVILVNIEDIKKVD